MMKQITVFLQLMCLALAAGVSYAQAGAAPEEDTAIKKVARDYIEGWYTGDTNRMEQALHPELAKRMVHPGPDGRSRLETMGAMTLVQRTRAGGGTKTPKELQQEDITILDRFNNAAVVKIVASGWVDYLELAKFDGEWKIVNVLWELKPGAMMNMKAK